MIHSDMGIIVIAIGNIVLALTVIALIISIIHKNRAVRHAHESMRSQLEIQEQSFDTIYKEIHDNIGQTLSLAKLNLHTVGPGLSAPADEKVRRSTELVGKAIMDLRDLGKGLNTQILKECGLSGVIQRELSSVNRIGNCQTFFSQDGNPVRLENQKELILFRVFQGALNNSIHHSKAKTVIVRLEYRSRVFNLKVSDDGNGLGEDVYPGIREMQNRASLIGANLRLSSTPRKGTTISINLPLEKITDHETTAGKRCIGR
jgi:two-component system NarL family sensor kinase